MTTLLCFVAYFVAAVVLFVVSALGFVTTDTAKWKTLLIALACFALSPLVFCFAGFTVPVLITFAVGYVIVAAGMVARTKLIQFKDRLLEELAKNLQDDK